MLYSPRNKILALGLMTEAFLYESQTRRGLSLKHFNELVDLADHCTICHRCVKPCPVKIDFGKVTTAVKAFLNRSGHRDLNPAALAGGALVDAVNPIAVRALHAGAVRAGFSLQRLGNELAEKYLAADLARIREKPANTTGRPSLKGQVIHLVSTPLPGRMPRQTMRAALGIEDEVTIPILRRPDMPADAEAVFYFPGCGSERLFGDVGLAVEAMLMHAGVQTVLPPGYRCCGHPQLAYGETAKAEKMMTENRVLFHRMANTLNYLDIKTVVVSCGTCIKALDEYEFDRIFPGCRIIDIHEFLLERGITMPVHADTYLYHDPCHTPLRLNPPLETVKKLTGANVVQSERCCGESGLFAVKRPDIASQVRHRKFEEIEKARAKAGSKGHVKMLTTCPGCLQGLSRCRHGRRVHRRRDGPPDPGRQLARPVHPHREERRHREGSRLGTPSLRAAPFPCPAVRSRVRRLRAPASKHAAPWFSLLRVRFEMQAYSSEQARGARPDLSFG